MKLNFHKVKDYYGEFYSKIDFYIIIFLCLQIGYIFFQSFSSINTDEDLKLILTINGLFSSILITYFFQRISWLLEKKKEDYNEAIFFSQKITDFRRILKILTDYYGLWNNDDATKNLLDVNEFKNIDYFDYKNMTFSEYKCPDEELIQKFMSHKDFSNVSSDLYLGMVSLVYDRKSNTRLYSDNDIYKDYQRKDIYNLEFIEKCVSLNHASFLWYFFDRKSQVINYHNLDAKQREQIQFFAERIDKKYKGRDLDDSLMADLCEDMNEHYFKEIHIILKRLEEGLTGLNLIIYNILISCIVFGLVLPLIVLFCIDNPELKVMFTKLLISINIVLLLFFVFNFYNFIKNQLKFL